MPAEGEGPIAGRGRAKPRGVYGPPAHRARLVGAHAGGLRARPEGLPGVSGAPRRQQPVHGRPQRHHRLRGRPGCSGVRACQHRAARVVDQGLLQVPGAGRACQAQPGRYGAPAREARPVARRAERGAGKRPHGCAARERQARRPAESRNVGDALRLRVARKRAVGFEPGRPRARRRLFAGVRQGEQGAHHPHIGSGAAGAFGLSGKGKVAAAKALHAGELGGVPERAGRAAQPPERPCRGCAGGACPRR